MPGLTPEPHFSSVGKGTRRGKRGAMERRPQLVFTDPAASWPWRWPQTQQHGRGPAPSLHLGSSGHLSGVCLVSVHTKPGSTLSTIAINRIYFVQPLLTYIQPQGFQSGCWGRKSRLGHGS